MAFSVESVRELADTRTTTVALALGGIEVTTGHAAGIAATVKVDGLTLGVSQLEGETEWIVDSCWVDGRPQWANGDGARYLRCKALSDADIIAELDRWARGDRYQGALS